MWLYLYPSTRATLVIDNNTTNTSHTNTLSTTRWDEFETIVFQTTVCLILVLHERQFWFSCITLRRPTTPGQQSLPSVLATVYTKMW
jgi:hypothetical protein